MLCLLLVGRTNSVRAETGSAAFEKGMARSDFLIVPSEKRIGPIQIGMPLDEVVTLLGQSQ